MTGLKTWENLQIIIQDKQRKIAREKNQNAYVEVQIVRIIKKTSCPLELIWLPPYVCGSLIV